MPERKSILLRLDPSVHDALARWASAELRSTNAQIEFLLRQALRDAGRLPREVRDMRGPGRPRTTRPDDTVRHEDTAHDTARDDDTAGEIDAAT